MSFIQIGMLDIFLDRGEEVEIWYGRATIVLLGVTKTRQTNKRTKS
ncbi:MAG: hypothetical protein WCE33_11025 [Nitrososphaeraceae archaeon]